MSWQSKNNKRVDCKWKNNSRHGLALDVLRHTHEPLTVFFTSCKERKLTYGRPVLHTDGGTAKSVAWGIALLLCEKTFLKSQDNNGVQHYVTGQIISHSGVWKLWFFILKMESIRVTSQVFLCCFGVFTGHRPSGDRCWISKTYFYSGSLDISCVRVCDFHKIQVLDMGLLLSGDSLFLLLL